MDVKKLGTVRQIPQTWSTSDLLIALSRLPSQHGSKIVERPPWRYGTFAGKKFPHIAFELPLAQGVIQAQKPPRNLSDTHEGDFRLSTRESSPPAVVSRQYLYPTVLEHANPQLVMVI